MRQQYLRMSFVKPGPPIGYQIYTTKFDVEVHSRQLDTVLGPLQRDDAMALDQAWQILQTGLLPWKTQLHLVAADTSAYIRTKLTEEARADTAITLLFDQSGSMRGQKMLFATATADVVQEFLLTLGFSCEILGFTTSQWRGGNSRRRWKLRFSPRRPGRLNDILHIIYKDAQDQRASTGGWDFRNMLRPDLPKENIDGEALIWAVSRLLALPAKRKYLIVLSDGAPVDDSTLAENGENYLEDHLHEVVEGIIKDGNINIAAMGIGYEAHDFYPLKDYVDAPNELGTALISLIQRMLLI